MSLVDCGVIQANKALSARPLVAAAKNTCGAVGYMYTHTFETTKKFKIHLKKKNKWEMEPHPIRGPHPIDETQRGPLLKGNWQVGWQWPYPVVAYPQYYPTTTKGGLVLVGVPWFMVLCSFTRSVKMVGSHHTSNCFERGPT